MRILEIWHRVQLGYMKLQVVKMDAEKIVKIILIVFFAIAIICGGCSVLNRQFGLEDDNPIEQAIELEIENETGIRIDLTPEDY